MLKGCDLVIEAVFEKREIKADVTAKTDQIAAGNLQPMVDWLRRHIWQQASFLTTDELASAASGETLNPAHFEAHLRSRYLGG